MNILVTGGAGYIGSHTLALLLARGHQAWAFDSLTQGHRAALPPERLIEGDLLSPADLNRAFSARRFDAVIHFAALALVGESVQSPERYYRNNVMGSLQLLEAMQRHEVHRIVFSSTCATYGIPESVPIHEDMPQRPINPYGNTKLVIELALKDWARCHGWEVGILRYFNAAGASPSGTLGEDHTLESHLIPIVLQQALGQRETVDILGTDYPTPDGTCIRDYIHVDDLADAHLRAVERLTPGEPLICNLGTGQGYSVREVIAAAEAVTGRRIVTRESPRRPGDPPVLVADSRRAATVLGWHPQYNSIRSIVETAWNWHHRHPQGYRTPTEPA
jgi:UDP-glucose-4-epimerase GalE